MALRAADAKDDPDAGAAEGADIAAKGAEGGAAMGGRGGDGAERADGIVDALAGAGTKNNTTTYSVLVEDTVTTRTDTRNI